MMRHALSTYALALTGVALVAWITSAMLPMLGLASAALLFLLPVLFAAARGGVGPGLGAALAGAGAYNYFLLPPRFTFAIHGVENIVSLVVLLTVALVTSRLATRLRAGETGAMARAAMSEETATLAAILGDGSPDSALARGVATVAAHHGPLQLFTDGTLPDDDGAFSPLDLAAAAWAMHNGDVTGHATQVMPAADWSFLPLGPANRRDGHIAALARPSNGETRSEAQMAQVQQLCILLGQGWDRVALERERRVRERLEDSDRLRRAFLASLAHDFRTPLTVITGQLAALAATHAEAADALDAAHRLDRTMTDLMGAARIEDGSVAPVIESLDLVDAVSAACAAIAIPDPLQLDRAIAPDLPFIAADPVLLHHILTNLLDNAVRHARSRITFAAAAGNTQVTLSICDDGPGVPITERAQIFDRFARLAGDDGGAGSGLGLAIVRGFADAMGMTVSVSDAPGGGACFALALQVASPAASDAAGDAACDVPGDAAGNAPDDARADSAP